ncbi:MAG: hypothetical protein ACOY3P_06655 [Planctomycetota bacterium]
MRLSLVSVLAIAVAVTGCNPAVKNTLPPAQMLMEPGPGVGGPGPGVMMYQPGVPCPNQTSQLHFVGPDGMQVNWDVSAPGMFDSEVLVAPARYNFPQGAIYRLKLTNVPGRPGVELYPTIEVAPAMPRTEAFLAHNAVPVQLTEEDLDQVLTGNFVTKVIYLPDPEFQELALAGVETLVSTRLDPGVDPIIEADRRGSILAILRVGNKDLQTPADMMQGGDVVQMGGPCPMGPPGAYPPGMVAGITAPQYGMPMSGTPIGLPGPPHIPLGVPAGLQKHVIANHTNVHIPPPTHKVRIDVKQEPGMSYPKPANHAWILEKTERGAGLFTQPHHDRQENIYSGAGPAPVGAGGACPMY